MKTKMSNMKLWRDGGPQTTSHRGGKTGVQHHVEAAAEPVSGHSALPKQHHSRHGSFPRLSIPACWIQLSVLTPDMGYRD